MIARKYALLAAAVGGLIPSAAAAQIAQSADNDDVVIVVTGQGLEPTPAGPAYATQEIDRAAIIETGSGRIEDALSSVAGFQQFRRSDSRSANPSAQGATLRALGGNASTRALVTLDGVPLVDPFFGYVPFSGIAPEQIGAIRITRGGGSGPFGAGALAGVIEMESANRAQLGTVQASALVNNRAETELSGSVNPRLGKGYISLHGRWDRGKGFFTTPQDQRVSATARAAFDGWSAGARLVQPLGNDVEVQARFSAYEDQRTLRFEGAVSSIEGQDASLRVVGRGDWQFDALAYAQWRNFTNIVISSTRFVPVLDQKDTPATGLGGKLELRPPVGPAHVLRLGVDYRRAEGDLAEDRISAFTGNIFGRRFAGGTNSNIGFFAENDWTLGNVVLTGGLRADRYSIRDGFFRDLDGAGTVTTDNRFSDRADWEVTWRAGALFNVSDELALRAAAYRGLRLPTLNELYRPFVIFPVVTEANAQLEPEFLEGFEAGLSWQSGEGVAFALTAFDNRVENAIANVTLTPTLRERQNLPGIEAQGIEASLGVEQGAISLDASLVYTDARIEGRGSSLALDGFRPPQTPEIAASATLAWEPRADWRFAVTLRHIGKQFEDDAEGVPLPAATTFNLFGQIPLGAGFTAILRGENMLDEKIVTRDSGGELDLGAPRTVWAGLRFGF